MPKILVIKNDEFQPTFKIFGAINKATKRFLFSITEVIKPWKHYSKS
jgi:hypothetical protein